MERASQRALRDALDHFQPDVVAAWQVGALSLGLLTTVTERGIPIVYIVFDDWLSYSLELDAWSRCFRRQPTRVGQGAGTAPRGADDRARSRSHRAVLLHQRGHPASRRGLQRRGRWTTPPSCTAGSTAGSSRHQTHSRARRRGSGRLLYVGRYDPRKGIETAIRALVHLDAGTTLEVQGTGDPAERDRLAAVALDLGVAERVMFGAVDRTALVERYRAADALVFPSEWEEPFGLVPLEAMACGTPVVATGVGGSGEFLLDPGNCVRFEAGDPADLAAAVRRLADDPVLRERLVDQGFRTARAFDVDRLTDCVRGVARRGGIRLRRRSARVAGVPPRGGRCPRLRSESASCPGTPPTCSTVAWPRFHVPLPASDAEIVVVDNASVDRSADVAAGHEVTVVRNPVNVGYARAMNQALSGSAAPVLIALNPDTEAPPGSLAALVERVHAEPTAGIVVPRLVPTPTADCSTRPTASHQWLSPRWSASSPRACSVAPSVERWWLEGAAPHDLSGPVDWAIGAVHAMRREALDGRPPYSERWFMYAEDLELCWRLSRRGWQTLLAADVTVPHVGNAAGEQAWGAGRDRRWWAASYDLYGQQRGAFASRRWAAVNTAGVLVHIALNALGSLLPGPGRHRRRSTARALARVLPIHGRALAAGPGSLADEAGVVAPTKP